MTGGAADLHGASRDSLAALRDRLAPATKSVDPAVVGEELFAVVSLLDSAVGAPASVDRSGP